MEDRSRAATVYPHPNGYSPYPYPVAAPPRDYRRIPVRRATCLRRISAFCAGRLHSFLAWVIALGLVALAVRFFLRPHLPEFRVDSLASFTARINLTAANPNKEMTLRYDHIDAAMFYKSHPLSETSVAPFRQGARNETSLAARFAEAGRFLEKAAAEGIGGENGNVKFNLRVDCRVRFEDGSRLFLKVFCGDLLVGLPAGAFTGAPRRCGVWRQYGF